MPSYRLPVFVWQDGSGLFSATPVEPVTTHVGTARSAPHAVRQVKEWLKWRYERFGDLATPDFKDPVLKKVSVPIRPRYRSGEREFPLDELFPLTLHCLIGRRSDDLKTCAAPLAGIRFDYYDKDSFKQLMEEAIRAAFADMTPRALSRFLPPKWAEVEEIAVPVRPKRIRIEDETPCPTLEEVAEPIGRKRVLARYSRAHMRDGDVSRLTQMLLDRQSSVLLVGPPGVGKSTILAEAVRRAEQTLREQAKTEEVEDEPEVETRHRFWLTNASRIIAGMQYLGEWEARCEALIGELSQIRGVLCLDRLEELVRVGGREATNSIAAFFIPYLQAREVRIVAEATDESVDACGRMLPGLVDLFVKLPIDPLNQNQTLRLLGKLFESAGARKKVTPGEGVIDQTHRLFQRFYPYRVMPGPAAKFLRDIIETKGREGGGEVSAEEIRTEFARRTGLPEMFLKDDEPLDAADVRETLRSQVIGQPEACAGVTHVVTTFKAGLNDPSRPLGVLLFCGPTGVGKTELSKALARFCFPGGEQSEHFFRLDMSEYLRPGSGDRLVTAPDGSPSALVKHVRSHPFSVVLFDEIEKASDDVFDVLLGAFEEGRITDPVGRVTHFQSTILIMTSNVGASGGQSVGFRPDVDPDYLSEVEKFFRPEFVNRIDQVIPFGRLTEEMIRAICDKELRLLSEREGLREAGLTLTIDPDVLEEVIQEGFDPDYGARPLKRAIEALIVTPLSRFLVDFPELTDAGIVVRFDAEGEVVVDLT